MGIKEIEAEIREYSDLLVIESNRYRDKTATEKWNEGKAIQVIEERKAKERQGTRTDIRETFPESDKGRTRDKIAESIGISGKTWEKLDAIGTEKPELLKDIVR